MKSISPRQLAQAIGVSEASVKRWCDRGLLRAFKTPGGHRRLAVDQVIAFLREKRISTPNLEGLGLPALTGTGATSHKKAAEAAREALLRGDRDGFERVLLDLYLAGDAVHEIGDRVIAPAFAQIGDAWQCGRLDVYEERIGHEACRDALASLRAKIPLSDGSAPVAVGGALTGDHYDLATILVELSLRGAGWNALSLGSHLPTSTFERAIVRFAPKLLWISVSHVEDPDRFVAEYGGLYERAVSEGIPVALGGQALTSDLRGRIRFTAYCETLRDLVEFARPLLRRADAPL